MNKMMIMEKNKTNNITHKKETNKNELSFKEKVDLIIKKDLTFLDCQMYFGTKKNNKK